MKLLKKTTDGFVNIIKGLGTNKDAKESTFFQRGMIIDQNIANNLYTYNWLAAKVVDAPVDDATRKWRNILIEDAEEKSVVEEIYKDFDVKGKFEIAMKWAKIFGGAAIVIIIDGQDPEEELNPEKITEGSLKNLIVLDRYNIMPGPIERNILSDHFGEPEWYQVVRDGTKIHRTRVVRFHGSLPTIVEAEKNQFWGLSIYSKLWEPIRESQNTTSAIASLVFETNIDVYGIDGLNSLVAEGRDDLVVKRLKLAHEMKSIVNGIVLDKEDTYNKKSNNFAKLPEIDDRFIQKVSGASSIPVTKLLGVSPSGLGATGESENRDYYDEIQSIQENDIRPRLDYIDTIITASAGIDDFEYEFSPLQQVTESEQADIDLKKAQRDQIYLDADVIRPTDAEAELSENGTYITIDKARLKEDIKEEEDLIKELEEQEEEFGTEKEGEGGEPSEELESSGTEISEGDE